MPALPECPYCQSNTAVQRAATGRDTWRCRDCTVDFTARNEVKHGYGRSTRKRSDRQEGFNARKVSGQVTANSGAGADKGDIKVRGLLREEDKTTRHSSFSLKLDDLRKVAAAAEGDEIPIMRISFEDDLRRQFVVVPAGWFNQLLSSYKRDLR